MAPPARVVVQVVVATAEVVQVIVDMHKDAAREGIPSSCSLSSFFRNLSCRSCSYSGTSNSESLPSPVSESEWSDRLQPRCPDEVSVSSSYATAAFASVSIAR